MMKYRAWLFLLLGLTAASCRREAFEQNRERLIAGTEIRGVGVDVPAYALQKTKESFVDLTIGLNTLRHEKKFVSLPDTVKYLQDVIFAGELPREYLSGRNQVVERFDGLGGWVLTFTPGGDGFHLGLNVGNDRHQPVLIRQKKQ